MQLIVYDNATATPVSHSYMYNRCKHSGHFIYNPSFRAPKFYKTT